MIVPLLVLASCTSLSEPQESAPVRTAEILNAARVAMGTSAEIAVPGGVRVHGKCVQQGIEGTFEFVFDPARGSFVHRVHSRMPEAQGFDGKDAWASDWSGAVRRVDFGGRASALGWFWVQSGYWLAPGSSIEVEHLPGRSNDDSVALELRMSDSPWSAIVFLDAGSMLPVRMERQRSGGERTFRFEDWRASESLGFSYAHRIVVEDVAGDVSTYTTEAVEKAPSFFRSPYQPVLNRPTDVQFDPGVAAAVESRITSSGHILVHPTLDGRDVGWFVLDTGAGALCIDPKIADQLELDAFGELSVVGVGGPVSSRYRGSADLRLGPLTLPKTTWVELDFQFLENHFGVPIGGVLGYELFARAVVAVDLEDGSVEVHDPANFELQGAWTPLALDDRTPCLEASFEGHTDWFRIDTGSTDTVTLHSPIVERLGLLKNRRTNSTTVGGVGGGRESKRGPLDWFELGGHRFEDPNVGFALPGASAFNTPYTAGNLGAAFLGHFRLVFDFTGGRVGLVARD